jgi:predicted MFS family arabinose efflux permease
MCAFHKIMVGEGVLKIPYGKSPWWVVAAAVAGLTVSSGPLIQFSFGAFLNPLASEFAVDRGTLSAAVLVALFMGAVFTLVVGHLIDRYGVRRVQLPAIVLFALAIAALSLTPPSHYAFMVLYGIAGALSAGQSPLGYAKSVAGNFEARRGLALGLSMSGVGVGAVVVPQLAQLLITHVGWRTAYVGLAAFVFIVAFPTVLVLLREPAVVRHVREPHGPGMTGRQALRTRELWYLIYTFMVLVASSAGVIAHVVPMLTDRGIAPQVAVSAISAAGVAVIFGRLIAGYLLDRIFAPYVTQLFLLVPFAGICLLYLPLSPTVAIIATTCVGLGVGAEVDLMAYLTSRYFGMRSFGQIYSYILALFMFGAGLGPFLMGISYTKTGSYIVTIVAFAISLLVASMLILSLGPYRYPVGAADRRFAEAGGVTS